MLMMKFVLVVEGSPTFTGLGWGWSDVNCAVYGKVRTLAKAFFTVIACTGTCYIVYPSLIHSKARVLAEELATHGELTLS